MTDQTVTAEYDGYIVCVFEKWFGIANRPPVKGQRNKAEITVPKSQCRGVTYSGCPLHEPGDAPGTDLTFGAKIDAIDVPRWWARQQQLIGWNE